AEAAMQRVEHRIRTRRQRGDDGTEIAADLDGIDGEAGLAQAVDHLHTARQADFAFGRHPAVEHRDTGHGSASGLPAGTPMRRISHSKVTPVAACTRRRTSSPNPSMSAADAAPVL